MTNNIEALKTQKKLLLTCALLDIQDANALLLTSKIDWGVARIVASKRFHSVAEQKMLEKYGFVPEESGVLADVFRIGAGIRANNKREKVLEREKRSRLMETHQLAKAFSLVQQHRPLLDEDQKRAAFRMFREFGLT